MSSYYSQFGYNGGSNPGQEAFAGTKSSTYQGEMDRLSKLYAQADGHYGGSVLAGSEANQVSNVQGGMQQQRSVDPWGFYRGSAADKLATNQGAADPSDMYRSKLQQMSTGQFGIDDPSYKFRLDQGQQALERSQASKGMLGSGNAAIELQQYGQGAASQEYGAQFNRMLQGMAGVEDQYASTQGRLMEMAGIRNIGAMNDRQAQDQAAADNANYQSGLARAQKTDSNPYAGFSFGGFSAT